MAHPDRGLPLPLRALRVLGSPRRVGALTVALGGAVLGTWLVGWVTLLLPLEVSEHGACATTTASAAFYGSTAPWVALLSFRLAYRWKAERPTLSEVVVSSVFAGVVCAALAAATFGAIATSDLLGLGFGGLVGGGFGAPFGAVFGAVHGVVYLVPLRAAERAEARGELATERLLFVAAAWLLALAALPVFERPCGMPDALPLLAATSAGGFALVGLSARVAALWWVAAAARGQRPGWRVDRIAPAAPHALPALLRPPFGEREEAWWTLVRVPPGEGPFRGAGRPVARIPERARLGLDDALLLLTALEAAWLAGLV